MVLSTFTIIHTQKSHKNQYIKSKMWETCVSHSTKRLKGSYRIIIEANLVPLASIGKRNIATLLHKTSKPPLGRL